MIYFEKALSFKKEGFSILHFMQGMFVDKVKSVGKAVGGADAA
jgi:hypothetical protein